MLISKRRIKWGIVLSLLVAVVVLVRPIRSWFDHALIRQFNPNLSVAQLKYHSDKSVIEIDQPQWKKFANRRAFGLTAEKAWLAVEQEALVERKIIIPHGRLEQAEMFLTESTAQLQPQANLWHTEIAKHLGRIDWRELQQHFSGLLASDEVHATWARRVSQWVSQSNQIQSELQQLMAYSEDEDNPLRYEEELRQKIKRIAQLSQAHQQILSQFSQVPELVEDECERLQTQFDDKSNRLNDGVLQDITIGDSRRAIAESIMLEIAQQAWTPIADFGAIATLNAEYFPRRNHPEYDEDVAILDRDNEYFSLQDLLITGEFVRSAGRSPFQLLANVSVNDGEQDQVAGEWIYGFDEAKSRTTVEITQTGEVPEIQFEIRRGLSDHFPSPSDVQLQLVSSAWDWSEESVTPLQNYFLRATGSADSEGLRGSLDLDLDYAIKLCEGSAKSLEILTAAIPLADEADSQTLTIGLAGTWEQPKFVLSQTQPSWLLDAIENDLQAELSRVNQTAESEVRIDFESQVGELIRRVRRSTDDGHAIVLSHGQQLTTAQETLQGILADITGDSFARRYEQETMR